MRPGTATIILGLAVTACVTVPDESRYAASAFSFSQCELPSLMDINVHQKFTARVAEKVYRLTNVHPTFDGSFTLLHDEGRHVHVIQDKEGRTVFEGFLDGVVRYAACVDIDADQDQDVIVELAAYGNHGNGTESFEVLLNDKGNLTRLGNSFCIEYSLGQENRAGVLTWYSAPGFCAVFVGEEADVTGHGTDADPLQVSNIRKVKEVWEHKNGKMRLISRSSVDITRDEVQYLSFR